MIFPLLLCCRQLCINLQTPWYNFRLLQLYHGIYGRISFLSILYHRCRKQKISKNRVSLFQIHICKAIGLQMDKFIWIWPLKSKQTDSCLNVVHEGIVQITFRNSKWNYTDLTHFSTDAELLLPKFRMDPHQINDGIWWTCQAGFHIYMNFFHRCSILNVQWWIFFSFHFFRTGWFK